jgi:hypothetical protein
VCVCVCGNWILNIEIIIHKNTNDLQ